MGDLPRGPVTIAESGQSGNNETLSCNRKNKVRELLSIPGIWRQVYAALSLSIAAFVGGTVEGWPGSMILRLSSRDNQVVHRPIHSQEISTIYVVMLVSAFIQMVVTGALMDRFGRRAGCWLLNFLAPSGWVFLATAESMQTLYVGAALIGSIAVSGEAVGVIFVSEIANDRLRGPLISLLTFFNSLGKLTAHVLGEEMDFGTFHIFCLCMTLAFPFFFWALPESPEYLMCQSRVDEARRSVAWYHGNDPNTIESEMTKLERTKKTDWSEECRTLVGNPRNLRTLSIVLGLSVLTELMGTSLIEVFAGQTLALVQHSPFTAKVASMVLASCRFVGGLLNVYFVERAGRKPILKTSLIEMAVSLIVIFGGLMSVDTFAGNNRYETQTTFYIVLVALIVYTFANQMYLGTMEVLSGEILSADTKGAMLSMAGVARVLTLIVCILIYNLTLGIDRFGAWNFFINCVFCVGGGYLAYHSIPETQGKTLNEIQDDLDK